MTGETAQPCGTLTGAPAAYPHGLREVAPGTYAWLQPNGGWGETNAGLVVGNGASLLVDTLWDDRLAARLLAAIDPHLGAAPLTDAVNTHRDGDHWWGNSLLPRSVAVHTSRAAAVEMQEDPPPADLRRLQALSRLGARLPGPVGRLSRYTTDMLRPFDFPTTRPRLPDHLFDGERTLDVGGRSVHLLHLGPAHTAGDVVVHVPDAGVVFAGDLVFTGATPVIWHGPVANWTAALDRLLGLDAEVFVPGHGPVADRTAVVHLRAYWEWLLTACEEQRAAGRPVREAIRRLATDGGLAPWRDWLAPERLAINVITHYRQAAGGGPLPQDPLTRARTFNAVADLARLLARRS